MWEIHLHFHKQVGLNSVAGLRNNRLYFGSLMLLRWKKAPKFTQTCNLFGTSWQLSQKFSEYYPSGNTKPIFYFFIISDTHSLLDCNSPRWVPAAVVKPEHFKKRGSSKCTKSKQMGFEMMQKWHNGSATSALGKKVLGSIAGFRPGVFLYEVFMLSLCLHGFTLCTPVFSRSVKTCMLDCQIFLAK